MAKTYTLHPVKIVAGRGKSSSYLSNNWNNLYVPTSFTIDVAAGESGDRVEDYYSPGTYIYDTQQCVNFMFDRTTLNLLRTKNITSVKFKTKVTGKLWASASTGLTQNLRYKYDSDDGSTTHSTSPHWASASDADSTAQGNKTLARFVSPSEEAQTVSNYEIELTLSENKIPKNGYVVGPPSLRYDTKFLKFSTTLTDTTLTVVTDEIENYTVTYSANGGNADSVPPVQTYPVGSSVTLSTVTPTRAGHRFLGWSLQSDAVTASYAAGSTQTFNANVTLYAVWERRTYTITYNANEGNNPPAAQTKTYGIDLTLTSDQPTRDGYAFLGWSTSNTASTAEYASGATYTQNGNATLYAVWSLITVDHTLTYNANGGIGAPMSETQTYSPIEPTFFTISSVQPTRIGHKFIGWASSASSSVAEYSAGDVFPASEDKTLYAVWQAIAYTVSYDANGGTGAPEAQSGIYGESIMLSSAVPTRDGYDFVGWAESDDAPYKEYDPGDEYTKCEDVTLYALWAINSFAVVYNANGGTNAPAVQRKSHGIPLVLTFDTPSRTGYKFVGWGLTSDANEIAYRPGGTYAIDFPITLYAIWRTMKSVELYSATDSDVLQIESYVVQNGTPVPCEVHV